MHYAGIALSLAAVIGLTALAAVLIAGNRTVVDKDPGDVNVIAAPNEPDDPPVCGGTDDDSNPNAPKTVSSTEIVSFGSYFSVFSYDLQDDPVLTARFYRFSAKKDGDRVLCTVETDAERKSFEKEPAFLDDIRKITQAYDFAQYNGLSVETHGLPEDFGATIDIDYASGEHIYAHHNTDMFLPMDAARALVSLFCPRVIVPYTSISMEKAMERMASEPDAVILDVRREDEFEAGHIPGAVCVPNEMIQEEEHDIGFEKDRTLLVYCRSGRRSKEAAKRLSDLGYTAVFEFGGILDWPGEIVTDEEE